MNQQTYSGPVWWSAGEALVWIAFRRFIEGGLWTGMLELQPVRDWHVRPPEEWWFSDRETVWAITAPALIAALNARAERRPRKACEKPPLYRAWRHRAAARRLVRGTGITAAALAAELQADLDKMHQAGARLEAAQGKLRDAVGAGQVQVLGRPVKDLTDAPCPGPRMPIPPTYFCGDDALIIEMDGSAWPPEDVTEAYLISVEAGEGVGQLWGGIELRAKDVVHAFPAADASGSVASPQVLSAPPQTTMPAFSLMEAKGQLMGWKTQHPTVMSGSEIRAWLRQRYSGDPTDGAVRVLMRLWPNRTRGPKPGTRRRNLPKNPAESGL